MNKNLIMNNAHHILVSVDFILCISHINTIYLSGLKE